MTTETKPAETVLQEGQYIHITTAFEQHEIDLQGTIQEISHRFLAIDLDVEIQDFLTAPETGTAIECAVTGNGCVYRFTASFRSSSALPEKVWFLEKPETVERIQMRRFVRVPMALPMQVRLPGNHGSLHDAKHATLVDISGGGICFASSIEVPLRSRIAIDIPELPLYGTLKTDAIVERCTPIEVPSGRIFHIGASLEDSLSIRQQDKLIQSIFQLQRRYLKKGLRMPNLDHTKPRNKT